MVVDLGVSEELAVLVVDVEAGVADDLFREGELRERVLSGSLIQVPDRGVAGPPVEGHETLGLLVVHDAAEVVLVVDDVGVFESDGVDGHDCRRRVGPILGQRRPEEFAIVVDSADVILDVTGGCESRVGDALAFAVVHQDMGVSGSGRAIGAVDDDVLAKRDGLLGPVSTTKDVPVLADVDHALRLARVAFKGDVFDRVPYCRPA